MDCPTAPQDDSLCVHPGALDPAHLDAGVVFLIVLGGRLVEHPVAVRPVRLVAIRGHVSAVLLRSALCAREVVRMQLLRLGARLLSTIPNGSPAS